MIQPRTKLEKLLYITVFIAIAIVLNLIEPPIFSFIPGAKLGLANLSTILSLYIFGPYDSLLVAFFRILLGALVKGTLHPIPFFTSFFGGMGSAVMMSLLYLTLKKYFSIEGISVIGGITNNLLQFFTVLFITKNNAFWYYLPVLLLLGGVSGWIIGVLSKLLYNRLKR